MAKKLLFKLEIAPALRKLEVLSKSLINTNVLGAYKSVFKGRGLEFAGYRGYTPNDDSLLIDWKASARTGELLLKEYIEERDINIFFILDASSSMLFGSIDKLKIEYAIELVASLSNAVLEAGDNVGIALVNDKVIAKIYPSGSKQQLYNITKLIIDPDLYEGRFKFNIASNFALNYLKESSVLIIVSDFISLDKGWEERLKLLSKKFDVIGIMVRDQRDKTLPKESGEIVIGDPHSNETLLIDPKMIKNAYESIIKKQEIEIEKTFHKNSADFVNLSTDKPFIKPILNLFKERAIKWK